MKITQDRIDQVIVDRDEMRRKYLEKKQVLEPERLAIEKLTRLISHFKYKLRLKKSNKSFDN